jgi:alpha-glucosidase
LVRDGLVLQRCQQSPRDLRRRGGEGVSQPWWHGAVIYQLYARSWRDSGGDGIGDLRGIIERLDYLAWLGVDGIWLSPTMPSPDADWGYDVSDYTSVHPELGTLADLDELTARAGQHGIRVLLDLVPNHTSSAHPWFTSAAHRDYYVWADPAADGGPPNNWKDFTGRSAWQRHESGQYYLHNFLPEQPDLNWHNLAVHREFRDILKFWFDRGIAGFRVDVAHGLYKDAQLRDNPPLIDGSRLDGRFGLRPVYNANRPETHGVFRDWRTIADGYSPARLLLGETWVPEPERMASYYGRNDELQLAFNFPFAYAGFDSRSLAEIVRRTLAALPPGACPVWMASNHDIGRFPSRWCGDDERKSRLALLVLATLPGTTVLYYGDEIGMADVDVPPSLRRDTATRDFDDNRDRARTPLRWDDTPGGGFTRPDVTPWLPMGDHRVRNVTDQRADPDSILWLCRRLLALRRAELGNRIADFEQLPAPEGQWIYRVGPLMVAANFSDRESVPPAETGEVLLTTSASRPDGGLGPWQGIIARLSRS